MSAKLDDSITYYAFIVDLDACSFDSDKQVYVSNLEFTSLDNIFILSDSLSARKLYKVKAVGSYSRVATCVLSKYICSKFTVENVMDLHPHLFIKWLSEVKCPRMWGKDALSWAAKNNHIELVKTLVAAGADVHTSILVDAAYYGHYHVVKLLINLGADTSNALVSAVIKGHFDIVKLLIDSGTYCSHTLFAASNNGHLEILQLLVGASRNAKEDSDSALRGAVVGGHVEIIKYLFGAFPHLRTDCHIALSNALANNHMEAVRAFIEMGVDIHTVTCSSTWLYGFSQDGLRRERRYTDQGDCNAL